MFFSNVPLYLCYFGVIQETASYIFLVFIKNVLYEHKRLCKPSYILAIYQKNV